MVRRPGARLSVAVARPSAFRPDISPKGTFVPGCRSIRSLACRAIGQESEIEKPVIAADERYALLPVKAPQGTRAHTGHAVAGAGVPRRAGRKDLLTTMAKGGL